MTRILRRISIPSSSWPATSDGSGLTEVSAARGGVEWGTPRPTTDKCMGRPGVTAWTIASRAG
jgi:hypothetical protein